VVGKDDGSRDEHRDEHGHDAAFAHELFAGQAGRRPDAPAIEAAGTRVTYRELDQSANRLAHHLRNAGTGPETMIGVCLERGAEAVRCLLAIMKAGGGYLPLDPSLPADRLTRICEQARPAVILTDRAGRRRAEEKLAGTGAPLLTVGPLPANPNRQPVAAGQDRQPPAAPDVSPHPDNVCYVIHTSGSTGHPKAVAVGYRALACVIDGVSREYRITARDRVVQLASLAFDTSVEQMLVTLASGATLLLPPAGIIAPTDLLHYLERTRATVIDLTPAYWHQLLAIAEPDDRRLRSLRLMITGGDMADPADCRAALRSAPGARLRNAYGLTETAITSALYDVPPDQPEPAGRPGPEDRPVPVGRPVRHARIMVLDERLDPVPAGTAGEIYIGGRAMARGYLGQPALTAAAFLPDPSGVPGARMYRTGDLGRWRDDGNLEVTGRADRQLKVRGFRVEPGEIERVLAGHPDIGRVAVVATRHGPGDVRLAAHYALRDGRPGNGTTDASLRDFLRARLPGYMIPTVFVALDRTPAPEGEPARTAPAPRQPPQSKEPEAEPRTPVQAGLSHLWCRLLKRDRIGLDDDFFALGGNSLLAAEMLARARVMFGIGAAYVRPLTRSLLHDPTLRGFARAAQDARAGRLADGAQQPGIDFAAEAELGVPVHPGQPRAQPKPQEILLTGSTGFLGAHLLHELLAGTAARIWCLVRAPDAAAAMARIAAAAERYDLASPPADRVVPLPGDLAAPGLGLSPGEFAELAGGIDVIYHAAAVVNFIYPYEELRAANVAGTREVIRLAGLYRGIPVHYVSTTAVLAGLGVMGVREVTEQTPLAHADRVRVGYVETKFVAEELLRNAARAGLPVAIYRPMDIVGGQRTGAWNTATEMCALIRFITDTGLAPGIDLPLDFVPADLCAAAIRRISAREGPSGQTYHLASPGQARLGALVGRLRAHGYPVRELPFDEWAGELLRYAARHPSHPMTPFLPLFVDRDPETGLTTAEMYLDHIFPRYSRSNTERALGGSGVAFPPVDNGILDRNIRWLIETGYLSRPGAGHERATDRSAHAG
jgi:amino acid adenylation domain-containing protein/thioester reductase-like protein